MDPTDVSGDLDSSLPSSTSAPSVIQPPESTGGAPALEPSPVKKRSKWEIEAEVEDQALRIKKKKKIAIQLRPREDVASPSAAAYTSPSRNLSPVSNRSGTGSPRPPPSARSRFAPLRQAHPSFEPCRSVFEYERLNHIEEGSYGVVFRARERATGDIVALKKLKLDEEKNGFPITSLREVMALMVCSHENVVGVREIVVGDTLTQIFIVMDFVEHDLKSLLSLMPSAFALSEVKTLLGQLLSATAHCHANWILHRDLKTSNLLMNNRGVIKVADFGLARRFGEPLGAMTELVVTLWYRAPELLLGTKEYSTEIDVWSIGCIFAELLTREPLFQGKGEIDQISQIFKLLGHPSEQTWPGWASLPLAKSLKPHGTSTSYLDLKLPSLPDTGLHLLNQLLCYDPSSRISADQALRHPFFSESPLPKHPSLFPSFPSLAAGESRRRIAVSPSAPRVHVKPVD